MKYWYFYLPVLLALLPITLTTLIGALVGVVQALSSRKPAAKSPEIIPADKPAPPADAAPAAPKRGRGRPRKYPPADPAAPKRKRGRPRKNPPTAAAPAETIPADKPAPLTAAPALPTDLDPVVYTPEEFAALIAD